MTSNILRTMSTNPFVSPTSTPPMETVGSTLSPVVGTVSPAAAPPTDVGNMTAAADSIPTTSLPPMVANQTASRAPSILLSSVTSIVDFLNATSSGVSFQVASDNGSSAINITDLFDTSNCTFADCNDVNKTYHGSRGGGVFNQNNEESSDDFNTDDAAWVLTATFIIFTMQSGFGLLESGAVSIKNEVNIMVKNVVDVVLGGFTYWLFGYALSFGESEWTNPFCAWGDFALNVGEDKMGLTYTTFFFQLSFATTATTIVSGAVAERCSFVAYVLFSAVNTVVYCIPAGWIWGSHGFLYKLGVIDIAGSCGVHLCGGASGFVAAYLVGPRIGRYDRGTGALPMGSPTNAILGMFMLWWGWLGFNCGSTFGIGGHKWKYAARTAVTTLQASIGGGLAGMSISWFNNHRLEVGDVVNSVLGALVSVTAGCSLFTTWEALIVGTVGGILAVLAMPVFDKFHIDDPVGATSVHGLCGFWAMVAIGLFVDADELLGWTSGYSGVFRGGGFYLLGVQTLACVCISVWAGLSTFIILSLINKFITPIRMSEWEELVGADFAEHGIRRVGAGVSRAVSVLGLQHNGFDYSDINPMGDNPCHQYVINQLRGLESRRGSTLSKAVAQVSEMAYKKRKLNKKGKRDDNRVRSAGLRNGSAKITPIELADGFGTGWP